MENTKKLIIILFLSALCFGNDQYLPSDLYLSGDEAKIYFYNGVYYVTFSASGTLAGNFNFIWPVDDGDNGEYIKTDGSGVLSFDTPTGAGDMLKATYDAGESGGVDILTTVDSTNASDYVLLTGTAVGTAAPKTDGALTYNAVTGTLSTGTVSAEQLTSTDDASVQDTLRVGHEIQIWPEAMGLSTDGRLYIFAEGSENYLALHSNDAGTSDIYSVQQLYFMCGDNDFSFMHNGYGDSYLRVNVDGTYPQIQSGNSIIDFTRLLGRSPVFRIDLSGTDPILTSDSGTISFDDENLSTTGTLTASEIILTEQSANPTIPSDGEAVIWLSDGTEYGDAGDVMIASATGGTARYTTLFDFSGGVEWTPDTMIYENGDTMIYENGDTMIYK